MNALVRFQPRAKLKSSFDVERGDFADYQKSNFGDWSVVFNAKHVGLDALKTTALMTSLLYPNAFFKSAPDLNGYIHDGYKHSPVDYMRYYMPNRRMVASNDAAGFAEEFAALVKQWKDEIFFHSSNTKIFTHPAYQRIIAMGIAGLPLVLRELRDNPDRWFYALRYMAGTDIAAGMKNAEDARTAWLEWGYKNNYI